MKIAYHKKVEESDLPDGATAETHLLCIEISDINLYAKTLVDQINDTSWISDLDFVARMSYESVAQKTISELVKIFQDVENEVTKEFGEFMISLSSGNCLKEKYSHINLPISELWKEKVKNNHGFDFHTISPTEELSFGEAKYKKSSNAYTTAAEQTHRFSKQGKDKNDSIHLRNFCSEGALRKLELGEKGYIVAFSISSEDYESILLNSLQNQDIKSLSMLCTRLYIIGVKV